MSASRVQRKLIGAFALTMALTLGSGLLPTRCNTSGTIRTQDESQLIGDWSGESICQVKNSPCHDEKVVYHVSKAKESGKVTVAADKIVDGRAVAMGGGDYEYNKEAGTLRHDDEHGVWMFKIKGNEMEGTLTLPDKTLYRRVTVKKD